MILAGEVPVTHTEPAVQAVTPEEEPPPRLRRRDRWFRYTQLRELVAG